MLVRIGIVTHNRASVLAKAIESALAQDYPHKEVVVYDDASTDDTPALVARFPEVRFIRVNDSIGYREARNRMMAEPGADLFCSLDDDSWFLDDDALSRTVPLFTRDPSLGAVGYEILDAGKPKSESDGQVTGRQVDTFIGCGHLLRLSAVHQVGLYEDFPAAYGTEEKDLSLRLLDIGYSVIELVGLPVWHDKTMTTRNVTSQHESGVLNDLAFATLRAPAPEVFVLVPAKMAAHLFFAAAYPFHRQRDRSKFDRAIYEQHGATAFVRPTLAGLLNFASKLTSLIEQRQPVSRGAYHSYRSRSRGNRAPYSIRDADGVAVSITTHNRRDDLAATLTQIATLTPPPDEIVVCLDGCNDGSAEMLAADWPAATVIKNPKRIGSIPSRHLICQRAAFDLVLLLDDDSFPIEPDFIARVRSLLDANPALGLVTFPQRSDESPASLSQSDFGPPSTIHTYQDSGSVIRRDLYNALGGYETEFEHAYEEPDLAVRCFEFGVPPLFWPHLTIRHRYTMVERNERRTHHLHARNELLSVVLRAPWILVLPVIAWRLFNQWRYALRRGWGWVIREPYWWFRFATKLPRVLKHRQPVSIAAYAAWLFAGRHPDAPSLRRLRQPIATQPRSNSDTKKGIKATTPTQAATS